MNVRDSESVSAILEAAGHSQAASEAEARLIVVNSCSVRGKAEDKALGKLGLLCAAKRDRPGLIVGVMGCMAQRLGNDIFKRVPALDFAVGTRRCGAIPRMVQRVLNGETGICEISDLLETPDVPDAHNGTACSAFVTILLGCERRCSYCIVPDVRGAEYSRPADEIVAEITALARNNIREVTLLGQSVMRYGLKNPVFADNTPASRLGLTEPFARLLEAVTEIPGIARVRFTSSHPSGCTGQLVQAMRSLPQVCRHLHLPCQSGSDRILEAMRRGYTRTEYLGAIRRLRDAMPDIAVTTDVIVGFPGETASDFEDTRTLMEEAGFDNAFIFKYSPRPGTPAAALPDDVPDDEKMRRNQVLLADQDLRGALINQRLVGTVQEVLAEG
ncbi:MAG: tRNA (N6-isopentenyl adenosine(37)-C2)-methylthiotransferase MiaB, partial [Kiritimatiellae bacterium]|nr:tRNA (N6-isopentenyl adenosine(37)-C2)-methylthiotransferase MiaB [Kiritimatiellia bacterium]